MGLGKINHTQLSNDFIDNYLHILSGSAVKIFITISRKTIGWHKETDAISISQIRTITGLSKQKIIDGVKELEGKEIITVYKKAGMSNKYTVNYLPVQEIDIPCPKSRPVPVQKVDTQNKDKETIQNKKDDLFNRLKEYFVSKYRDLYNEEFINYPKEMKAIKTLVNKIKDERAIGKKIKLFEDLVTSRDKFWSSIPFLPSMFLSLYDRIVDNGTKNESPYDNLKG